MIANSDSKRGRLGRDIRKLFALQLVDVTQDLGYGRILLNRDRTTDIDRFEQGLGQRFSFQNGDAMFER